MGGAPPDAPPDVIEWHHLGRIDYAPAIELQRMRWRGVVAGTHRQALYTLEHNPVVTIGRRGALTDLRVSEATLAARGIQLAQADRGGELTYHGVGQLVFYAVVSLTTLRIGVGDLVRALAGGIAAELSTLGIECEYDPAHPGLWVGGKKICAVGMRVASHVSSHGAALNLTTALDAFDLIVPCGMPEAKATSVLLEGVEPPPQLELARRVVARFGDAVGWAIEGVDP